jgi:long-chain fatty acid transport protein
MYTALGAAALVAATPSFGAGFSIFEQGSRAMGMAGAYTAQAEDGSAMFHNVAGLAFQQEGGLEVGVTLITFSESEFEGAAPFPGTGATGEQESNIFFPPHAYWVKPINDRFTFGFSMNSPFGLTTEWKDPDTWSGRFLSNRAELQVVDLGANFGWKATDTFGVGFGVIGRASTVELERHSGIINPFTFRVVDVANVALESDMDFGYGFQVGILHKINNSFSWGFSYRSKVEVDYGGDGLLTQISTGNAQLDAAVAAQLPLGQSLPIETSIEFPDTASFGVALALSAHSVLEIDVNWTGWSSFDDVVIDFTTAPALTSTLPQGWDDVYNYRIGYRVGTSSGSEWRFGYVYDESPQPDEGVSPLLPDADRNGFTVGWGRKGARAKTDIALMYLPFDERVTNTNRDNFNGTYNTTAWLLGATLSF